MIRCDFGQVAARVRGVMMAEDFRIVRLLGGPGLELTPVLAKVLQPLVLRRSSMFIDNIHFDSEHGLLGWVSNAMGLYEEAVASRGKVPPHLTELFRLRAVKYLIIDNFHDLFHLQGVSKIGMARDINSLLLSCDELKLVIANPVSGDDSEFISLIKFSVCDIRI